MLLKLDHLSIGKRDADCYDVYYKGGLPTDSSGARKVRKGRVAAIRADFAEDERGLRTALPGTWRIRWDHKYEDEGSPGFQPFAKDTPEAIASLRFQSVHEAFAFYCSQVLL